MAVPVQKITETQSHLTYARKFLCRPKRASHAFSDLLAINTIFPTAF
jgi:hypothetical protein